MIVGYYINEIRKVIYSYFRNSKQVRELLPKVLLLFYIIQLPLKQIMLFSTQP